MRPKSRQKGTSTQHPLRLITLMLLSAGMSVGLITACNPNSSETTSGDRTATETTTNTSKLKLLYWQAPPTLNPHLSPGSKDLEAASQLLEPLAAYNEA